MRQFGEASQDVLWIRDAEKLQWNYLTPAFEAIYGPVGTVQDALALIEREPDIDGAILDANLHSEMAFPVADALQARGVQFVFTTGYDASRFPSRFNRVIRCEKPVSMSKVTQAIGRLIHADPSSGA